MRGVGSVGLGVGLGVWGWECGVSKWKIRLNESLVGAGNVGVGRCGQGLRGYHVPLI